MAYVPRKYIRRGKKAPKRAKKGFRKAKKYTGIKKMVSKMIHAQIEDKTINAYTNRSIYGIIGASNFYNNNIYCLTPNNQVNSSYTVVQGVSQQSRIGNKIRMKKCTFRGTLLPNPYNATTNNTIRPQNVALWVFSIKSGQQCTTVQDAYNVLNNSFFQYGSTDAPLLGNLFDLMNPVNKDVVTLHTRRVFKIGYESYTGVTGGANSDQTLSSNDYKLNAQFVIDCTRYLPKVITFNDGDGQSTSRQVFVAVEAIPFNGASNGINQAPVAMFSGIDFVYEDA